jgi:hypothetical protein
MSLHHFKVRSCMARAYVEDLSKHVGEEVALRGRTHTGVVFQHDGHGAKGRPGPGWIRA